MSHNEVRGAWHKEALMGLTTGFLYGATNCLVGHPFDTVKTKMQAQDGYMGKSLKYVPTVKEIYRVDGWKGYYRGVVPPFFGSVIYRSV